MEPSNITIDEELTIDPETGLPSLPDNLAWKVYRSGMDELYVFLVFRVEHSPGFWKKLFGAPAIVTWSDFHGSDFVKKMKDNTKEGVLDAATSIYLRLQERSGVDDLVGIYPPKSIL